jgi:hypothetical protein
MMTMTEEGGGEILDVEGVKFPIGLRIGRGRSGKNLSKNMWRERRFLPDHTPDLGSPDLRSHLGHQVGHLRRSGARSGRRSGEKTLEIMGLKLIGGDTSDAQ